MKTLGSIIVFENEIWYQQGKTFQVIRDEVIGLGFRRKFGNILRQNAYISDG